MSTRAPTENNNTNKVADTNRNREGEGTNAAGPAKPQATRQRQQQGSSEASVQELMRALELQREASEAAMRKVEAMESMHAATAARLRELEQERSGAGETANSGKKVRIVQAEEPLDDIARLEQALRVSLARKAAKAGQTGGKVREPSHDMLESSGKEHDSQLKRAREEREQDEEASFLEDPEEAGGRTQPVQDPVAEALSSLAASQHALLSLARGERLGDAGTHQDKGKTEAPDFVKHLPKRKDMDWGTVPASPLAIEQHDVRKLLARADKWDGMPSAWDLREANKKLAKEIPSAHPTVSRENALFTQNILRALLLISADIETAYIERDGDAILTAIEDMRWAIGAGMAKATKELFQRAFYDKDNGKKRDAGKTMELLQGLEEHREMLLNEPAVQAAVFLSANFGDGKGKDKTVFRPQGVSAKRQGNGNFMGKRHDQRKQARGQQSSFAGGGQSNLQRQLQDMGAGASSQVPADGTGSRNPYYKGNNYDPNFVKPKRPGTPSGGKPAGGKSN